MPISPRPLIPIGLTIVSGSSTKITLISCTSAFTGTWYSAMLAFMVRPKRWSICVSSCNAIPMWRADNDRIRLPGGEELEDLLDDGLFGLLLGQALRGLRDRAVRL